MGDPQWLAYLDQVKTQIQGGSNPDFAARLTAILDAQETRIPPPPVNNPLLQGGGDNGRRSGGLLDLDNDATPGLPELVRQRSWWSICFHFEVSNCCDLWLNMYVIIF